MRIEIESSLRSKSVGHLGSTLLALGLQFFSESSAGAVKVYCGQLIEPVLPYSLLVLCCNSVSSLRGLCFMKG